MTATSNLGITPIASNQAQKEITANDAVERLAGALADHLDVVMADADVTLTAAEALAHVSFKCTGALTAGRNLVVPTNTKLYSVLNATTGGYAVTVKTASGTGVAVVASTEAIVRCDGTNVVAVAAAGGGSIVSSVFGRSGAVTAQSDEYTAAQVTNAVATSRQVATGTGLSGGGDLSADRTLSLANTAVSAGSYTKASITVDAQGRLTAASSAAPEPYDIASFYPGVPGNSQVLLRFVAPRAISLPSGLTGSYGSAGTASTGTANIDVTKNGSSIGTVVYRVGLGDLHLRQSAEPRRRRRAEADRAVGGGCDAGRYRDHSGGDTLMAWLIGDSFDFYSAIADAAPSHWDSSTGWALSATTRFSPDRLTRVAAPL